MTGEINAAFRFQAAGAGPSQTSRLGCLSRPGAQRQLGCDILYRSAGKVVEWGYTGVGAGSAGCALARELADAGETILVIEAGGSGVALSIKVAAGQP